MVATLSINLNAVAMLRNRRDLPWPSVTGLGRVALDAGASGLTVHPRPDQRHIRFSDLGDLRALIDDEFPQAEFNIEGYPSEEFLALVEKHEPEQVTLVPDDPAQNTSDHGWDFAKHKVNLTEVTKRLKSHGMRVSMFADPTPDGLEIAKETGADRVEFFTGPYGGAYADPKAQAHELALLERAALKAVELGLGINAGHDLTVANLPALVKIMPTLSEVSIGHGLTADALEYGMRLSVQRFIKALG
ncbi:pyridoxine 5'-phosphate synthase [Pseudochrobactrum kiredjianiae]|uniref:Pyridoxine 5'-phosphate synthase n=1 Tax=Pseudochrobactrum kiredjianiae TaxID=386305 RepID=A0ABW3V290_9HYPH|nr:pyridoxine 5'-phosphate synthase [Pseudochrobactrum kiredjianiae]MDM7851143.1 pyridoxine 5'-phosphate synthase [Pseudochrobactrum kiredjianiae]